MNEILTIDPSVVPKADFDRLLALLAVRDEQLQCALAGPSAPGALLAERDATIASLGARLAVAEADYLRRHREPAERYERIAQLEAHNLEGHQVRIRRITRLRLLETTVRAAETNSADTPGFRGLTTAVLAEIDALLME